MSEWIFFDLLGKGTFGKVFRGQNSKTKKKRAIKVIEKKNLANDELSIIKNEHHILSQLKCRHIVRLYQTIETSNEIYMMMELLEGGNLFEYISKSKNLLSEWECCNYFIQMAKAVKYCHDNNIAHRDIKLENFVFNKSRTKIKLIDFGFCYKFNQTNKITVTTCGSAYYASPEVLNSYPNDPTKIDIWSLGVTLYAMLTKRLPFLTKEGFVSLYHQTEGIEKIIPPYISDTCSNLLINMVAYSQNDRLTINQVLQHPWCKNHK